MENNDKKRSISGKQAKKAISHFNLENASNSIKHFFKEEKASVQDSPPGSGQLNPVVNKSEDSVSYEIEDIQTKVKVIKEHEKEFRYDMNHDGRGCFVIFNQKIFDDYNKDQLEKDRLDDRDGTEVDARNLKNAAVQLGFEVVEIFNDLKKKEIQKKLDILSKIDHSRFDCFGCAILTHGSDRDILYVRDDKMKLTDFTRPFGADRCRTLASKPKLFFINACRGDLYDAGITLKKKSKIQSDCTDGNSRSSIVPESDDIEPYEVTIPVEADFLIANSTCPEYFSFRNPNQGSCFIQSLCVVLEAFGDTMELMQMMTRINRMVAYDFVSSTNDETSNKKKQIPSIATRLTAELYFTLKRITPPDLDEHINAITKMISEMKT